MTNEEKRFEAAYLLCYISLFEKFSCILNFLYAPIDGKVNKNLEDKIIEKDGVFLCKKKETLAKFFIDKNFLSTKEVETFRKFKKNRDNLAHELWNTRVEKKTDYLGLCDTLKICKNFCERKRKLFEDYNKQVKEKEKIDIDLIFSSIKSDLEILLDKKYYKNILESI